MMRTAAIWILRTLWFLLPLTLIDQVSISLSGDDAAVRWTVAVGLWALWAIGLAAVALPLPSTLAIIRTLAPATVGVGGWLLFTAGATSGEAIAVAHGVAVTVVALSQLIGDLFVDGASYGNERRMLLRPQISVLTVGLPLTWATTVTGLVAGPLLLAHRQWVLGVLATGAGAALVLIGGRAMYELTRRWIVFVPNGFVLHDYATVTEPVLFRQSSVERLGAAIAGSPARDLSGNAAGLLLECELTDPAPLGLVDNRRSTAQAANITDVRRFLFAPTRPGALLDEAERRSLPVR